MSLISFSYVGDLQVKACHDLSGTELLTDAPPDNKGQGRSFSPTDLMVVSIASCYLTVIGIGAEEMGVDLTGMTATAEKIMANEPVRRIGEVKIEIQMPASIPEDKRAELMAWAKKCPVCKSVAPELKITVKYQWQ